MDRNNLESNPNKKVSINEDNINSNKTPSFHKNLFPKFDEKKSENNNNKEIPLGNIEEKANEENKKKTFCLFENTEKENEIIIKMEKEKEKLNTFYLSIKYLLIGKAYEMQENKESATKNYIESLRIDPGNIEAFEAINNLNIFSGKKRENFFNDLRFELSNNWLHDYYFSKSTDNILITENSSCITKISNSLIVAKEFSQEEISINKLI